MKPTNLVWFGASGRETAVSMGFLGGKDAGGGMLLVRSNSSHDLQYRTSSIIVGSIMNRTYDYDPNGNITSNIDAIQPPGNETLEDAGAYTYQQATNKLTQVEGELNVVYGYDANGNITSANNRTFVYDLSNRLIRVEDNGVTVSEYVYNGLNQRIKKILPTGTRIFHYDRRGHLIAETDETGQVLVEYIYLGDQPLAMIRPGEALYYYHHDHLGTPQIVTNDSGAVSWKAVYAAFGEAEMQVEAVENPFRFPGQYYDQETGLHYNWNRYYDPRTGRYLTPDPIGLEGGINLFIYVDNNPLIKTDPHGLKVIPLGCSSKDATRIQDAAGKADAASQSCLPCKNREDFRNKIRNNLIVACLPSMIDPATGLPICGGAPKPKKPEEGVTPEGAAGRSWIGVTPEGIAQIPGCGCLQATILHEVIHLLPDDYSEDQVDDMTRNCFTCASRPYINIRPSRKEPL